MPSVCSSASGSYHSVQTSRRDSTMSYVSVAAWVDQLSLEDEASESISESDNSTEDSTTSTITPETYAGDVATVESGSTKDEDLTDSSISTITLEDHTTEPLPKPMLHRTESEIDLDAFTTREMDHFSDDEAPEYLKITLPKKVKSGTPSTARLVEHLVKYPTPSQEGSDTPIIVTLGLFLRNPPSDVVDEVHVKKEVKDFVAAMQSSPSLEKIAHLYVGWSYVVDELLEDEEVESDEDDYATGEKRLHEEAEDFTQPRYAETHTQNQTHRTLLLRIIRWVAMALPNIRTLTFHGHNHFLHFSMTDGYFEELIAPFSKLREVNVVCEEPFVALSYRVRNGRRTGGVSKSMTEMVQKLNGREYYENRG